MAQKKKVVKGKPVFDPNDRKGMIEILRKAADRIESDDYDSVHIVAAIRFMEKEEETKSMAWGPLGDIHTLTQHVMDSTRSMLQKSVPAGVNELLKKLFGDDAVVKVISDGVGVVEVDPSKLFKKNQKQEGEKDEAIQMPRNFKI